MSIKPLLPHKPLTLVSGDGNTMPIGLTVFLNGLPSPLAQTTSVTEDRGGVTVTLKFRSADVEFISTRELLERRMEAGQIQKGPL